MAGKMEGGADNPYLAHVAAGGAAGQLMDWSNLLFDDEDINTGGPVAGQGGQSPYT